MNLLSFVLQTGLKENHPSCNTSHCINRKQKRMQCHVCVEVCPNRVYDAKQAQRPKWSDCMNCGLCVSSCPARCIAPSAQNLAQQFELTKLRKELRISCLESETLGDYTVPCLAALPWEMLAYIALQRPVTFAVGHCAQCQYPSRVKLVQRELGLLLQFLGEEVFAQQVRLEFETKEVQTDEKWSRRGFLQAVSQKTLQGAGKLLTEGGERYDGLFYREMLAELVRARRAAEAGKQERYYAELPRFKKECYGCGVCVKLCPNQALEIGQEKEGKRPVYITPWRCTGCGVCGEVCREKGIAGVEKMRVPHLDRLLLAEVPSASCQVCGRPVRPGGEQLCVICRQKKKSRG